MHLRSLDEEGQRAYLNELRPRFFAVRIEAGKVRLRWWLPTWAIEEPLRFLLRLWGIVAAVAPAAARRLRRSGWAGSVAAGRLFARPPTAHPTTHPAAHGAAGDRRALWSSLDELFSEADRDLLALPNDLPFLDVTTHDVRIYVGQIRL